MSIKHSANKGSVRMQATLVLVLSCITVAIIWLLVATRPEPAATLDEFPPLNVVVQHVQKELLQPNESLTGRLQPVRTATLRFEVDGVIQHRPVEPGEWVEVGAVILEIDPSDYRDRVTQAKTELALEQQMTRRDQELLELTEQNVVLQEQEVNRLNRLSTDSLIAQSQLDDTRQQLLDLRAELAKLRYQVDSSQPRIQMKSVALDTAQRQLARTHLKAPFAGKLNTISVEVGDYVTATQPVVTLVDTSALDLVLHARSELTHSLQLGQPVTVFVDEKRVTARVVALQVDPSTDTNTHEIRLRLTDQGFVPGGLATAQLPLGQTEQHLLVPVSAVLHIRNEAFVFVYDNGVARKTPVQLGYRDHGRYAIRSGLSENNQVIARDVASLQDGQRVVASNI